MSNKMVSGTYKHFKSSLKKFMFGFGMPIPILSNSRTVKQCDIPCCHRCFRFCVIAALAYIVGTTIILPWVPVVFTTQHVLHGHTSPRYTNISHLRAYIIKCPARKHLGILTTAMEHLAHRMMTLLAVLDPDAYLLSIQSTWLFFDCSISKCVLYLSKFQE